MTELQFILLISAIVFVVGLYWWGKRSKPLKMVKNYGSESLSLEEVDAEPFDVIVKPSAVVPTVAPVQPSPQAIKPEVQIKPELTPAPTIPDVYPHITLDQEEHSLTDRLSDHAPQMVPESVMTVTPAMDVPEIPSQVFALLVIDPTRQFNRKDIHQAMMAAGLGFTQQGVYVFRDVVGNDIFRIANVVEPGYFPDVDDVNFSTLGVALVLELPAAVTPYRAMNEFITAARKISQNLGGHLYDAQRSLIKETHLKEMREYAQSITY